VNARISSAITSGQSSCGQWPQLSIARNFASGHLKPADLRLHQFPTEYGQDYFKAG